MLLHGRANVVGYILCVLAAGRAIEPLEVENLIEAAQATIVSAAARRESRGAHTVYDYGDTPEHPNGRNDADWHKHSLWYSAGNRLSYKAVQMKPLTVDSVPMKVRTF